MSQLLQFLHFPSLINLNKFVNKFVNKFFFLVNRVGSSCLLARKNRASSIQVDKSSWVFQLEVVYHARIKEARSHLPTLLKVW